MNLSLAFLQGSSLFAHVIRMRTGSPFTHVEILDEDTGMAWSADTWKGVINFPWPHERFTSPYWYRCPIVLPNESMSVSKLIEEVGCKYDWLGILFSQTISLGREHKNRWFCSELTMAALRAGGASIGKDPHWYSPGDIWQWIHGIGDRYLIR